MIRKESKNEGKQEGEQAKRKNKNKGGREGVLALISIITKDTNRKLFLISH